MKTKQDVIKEADLQRTDSILFHPFMSLVNRRAARADMDRIVQNTCQAAKDALAAGQRWFRVEVSGDAAMALKKFRLFRNTPERALFLRRLADEAGIDERHIRFITRTVEDPNGMRGGQIWEAEMLATFLEVRLPEKIKA